MNAARGPTWNVSMRAIRMQKEKPRAVCLFLKTENGIARENHSGLENRQRLRFESYLIRNQMDFVIGEKRLKSFMMHWGSMGN